jgi:hypothetical protein
MATHNEPQSYGSQDDWTSGKTGQSVNDPKSEPTPEHADFYESKVEADTEGGSVSPVQLADTEGAHVIQHGSDDAAVQRVTGVPTGAKREGFFKDRDYRP